MQGHIDANLVGFWKYASILWGVTTAIGTAFTYYIDLKLETVHQSIDTMSVQVAENKSDIQALSHIVIDNRQKLALHDQILRFHHGKSGTNTFAQAQKDNEKPGS